MMRESNIFKAFVASVVTAGALGLGAGYALGGREARSDDVTATRQPADTEWTEQHARGQAAPSPTQPAALGLSAGTCAEGSGDGPDGAAPFVAVHAACPYVREVAQRHGWCGLPRAHDGGHLIFASAGLDERTTPPSPTLDRCSAPTFETAVR